MAIFKITFAQEKRRFQLPEEANQFALLQAAVQNTFGLAAQETRISYVDDEGDKCMVGGNDELREAMRFFKGTPTKLTIERVAVADAAAVAAAPVEAPVSASAPAPAPAPTPVVATASQEPVVVEPVVVKPQPSAQFVRDVTLPDGSSHACMTKVVKTWEIRNNGEAVWPANSRLVLVRDVKSDIRLTTRDAIILPQLLPGESTEVSVELSLPGKRKEGDHKIFFKLIAGDNKRTFAGDFTLFADLKVEAPLPALTKRQFIRAVPQFLMPEGQVDEEVRTALTAFLDTHPGEAVHATITCDGCNQFPLKGARFKCTVCPDFDLCATCEAKGSHPLAHPLLKITRPFEREEGHQPGHHRQLIRSLLQNLFGVAPGCGRRHHGKAAAAAAAATSAPAEPTVVPEATTSASADESKETDEGAVAAATPKPVKGKKIKAEFVADVNLSDGSEVPAGAPLLKKWSIKNSGQVAWPLSTVLMEVTRGLRVVAPSSPVPAAQPGETVEVSMNLADVPAGRVNRLFRLAADGARFGPRIWIDVTAVAADAAAAPRG